MKWDINNSKYALLWDRVKGTGALQEFLSADMVRMNYGFWATQFKIDPAETPRNNDGTAVFSSKMREIEAAGLLNWRAPLSDTVARDKTGMEYYTGTIPDFSADGFVETAQEREYKQKMLESYFGDDTQILLQYADTIQGMINDADQTLNYMSAQLLSDGKISYNYGKGITGDIYAAKIVDANRVKAGKAVWSDPTTKILDQMRQIEVEAQDRWGVYPAMKWQIPYDMFVNVFLTNNQVKEQIRYQKSLNNQLFPEVFDATMDMALDAIAKFEGVSPIEIIVEKEKDKVANRTINGWKANMAVLRPAGYAGLVRHTSIYDQAFYEKYGNKAIDRSFARVGQGGLYTLMNTVIPNGNVKEWHTDLFVSAIPSLDEFLYHIIVDTASANE